MDRAIFCILRLQKTEQKPSFKSQLFPEFAPPKIVSAYSPPDYYTSTPSWGSQFGTTGEKGGKLVRFKGGPEPSILDDFSPL